MLDNKKLLLLISGGIASYKMAALARSLIKKGAQLRVAMTPHACEFISPLTFETLTKQPVVVDDFDLGNHTAVHHIEWAQWADQIILAPATANSLAKLAWGLADNFVSTVCLASPKALFIVPAMNDKMYDHPATQRNIQQLKDDGHHVMPAAHGFLAEGYECQGRLPDQEEIIEELEDWMIQQCQSLSLRGKTIIVTAGGTRERIDPVRYLTNDSSGRMGHALAQAAYQQGAKVILITASSLASPSPIQRIQVESAQDMLQAVESHFDQADALIMSAAVSDYRPLRAYDQKIKKTDNQEGLTIEMIKNPDILQRMAEKKEKQILVGFAAETQDIENYAWDKLKRKSLDMIIANDVSQNDIGFNSSDNAVLILTSKGDTEYLAKQSKTQIAKQIIEKMASLMEEMKND